MLKTYVWSVLLYGCETWCISDSDRNKLDAFEMWCYRRMQKISWRDHISNEAVLKGVGEIRSLDASIRHRRAQWLGHLIRHENIARTMLEGTIEGENKRGRPRREYLSQILHDMHCTSYQQMRRLAEDRTTWRETCRRLLPTSPRTVT